MIVTPSADLELAVRAIAFAAVGTAGQRCTTLRRLIVHEDVYDELIGRLEKAYATRAGRRSARGRHAARAARSRATRSSGCRARSSRRAATAARCSAASACWPTSIPTPTTCGRRSCGCRRQTGVVETETFAPLLYALRYRELDDALALHNGVPQGLSSCIFTNDLREAERFLSVLGSDCGIANVNIGPSRRRDRRRVRRREGDGRRPRVGLRRVEGYMRRQTATINYSTELPLAQGVRFDVG